MPTGFFDTAGAPTDEQSMRWAVTNQARLRGLNGAMRREGPDALIAFRCECGRLGCNALLLLTRAEHDAVRAGHRRFAIAAGHEVPEIDSVVEVRDRYAVVELRPRAAAILAGDAIARGQVRT